MCIFVTVSQISNDGNHDSGDSGGLTTVSLVVIIIVAIIVLTTLVIIIVGVGVYCHRKLRFVYNILCILHSSDRSVCLKYRIYFNCSALLNCAMFIFAFVKCNFNRTTTSISTAPYFSLTLY